MIWYLKFNKFMGGGENLQKPGQLVWRRDEIYATGTCGKSDGLNLQKLSVADSPAARRLIA